MDAVRSIHEILLTPSKDSLINFVFSKTCRYFRSVAHCSQQQLGESKLLLLFPPFCLLSLFVWAASWFRSDKLRSNVHEYFLDNFVMAAVRSPVIHMLYKVATRSLTKQKCITTQNTLILFEGLHVLPLLTPEHADGVCNPAVSSGKPGVRW